MPNLTDGSAVGDWRLPNLRELHSLVHCGVIYPAVPNTAGTGQWVEGDPFSGVETAFYWSSTPGAPFGGDWWVTGMDEGIFALVSPTNGNAYVWPVRGGQ